VENYSIASGNTAPRGAASSVAGDKVWVVDSNNKVFVYNNAGLLLGSWTATAMKQLEGITTNGTDIWLVDRKHKRVFRYDGEAARLSGQTYSDTYFNLVSGNAAPKDLVRRPTQPASNRTLSNDCPCHTCQPTDSATPPHRPFRRFSCQSAQRLHRSRRVSSFICLNLDIALIRWRHDTSRKP
jgi:hypothetical protein